MILIPLPARSWSSPVSPTIQYLHRVHHKLKTELNKSLKRQRNACLSYHLFTVFKSSLTEISNPQLGRSYDSGCVSMVINNQKTAELLQSTAFCTCFTTLSLDRHFHLAEDILQSLSCNNSVFFRSDNRKVCCC